MPLLNVVLVPGPDQVVVRVTGDADLSTEPVVAGALVQAAELGTRQVVVDVAGARFWDCSGLHTLTAFTAGLAAAGRSCRVVGATAATRRLIRLADLARGLNLAGPVRELPERQAAPAAGDVRSGPTPAAPRARSAPDGVAVPTA